MNQEMQSTTPASQPHQEAKRAGSATATVSELLEDLLDLTARREHWESGLFRTSNAALYGILGDCLKLYYRVSAYTEGSKKVLMEVVKHLEDGLASRQVRFTKDTHLATKVVRYVFSTERRRASAYSIVLRAAIAEGIAPEAMVKFIEDRGGIEEIRLQGATLSDEAPRLPVEERIERTASEVVNAPKLATVVGLNNAALARSVKGPGLHVALVEVSPDGVLGVKWIGQSKGAIRLALLACASGEGVVRNDTLPAGSADVVAANDSETSQVA